MNVINVLDNSTIDKIAAGEVVDRPASIVKELVENSLDSGATFIDVEVKNGGKSYIKISDNGSGIASSEVKKAFLRHATSKITSVEDLNNILTLGFRGEALAAISSVTKVEIKTRIKEEPVGTHMIIEGGVVVKKEPIGTNVGTTIEIKDLFYNVPARKKFLKSDSAETVQISNFINKISCGNPRVKFRYISNSKTTLMTPGNGALKDTIRSVFGRDVSSNLIEVDTENKLFKLDGYICSNREYRSNRNLQVVFINGRLVRSKVVSESISEAYKSVLPINKHGICFLNMTINPSSLDVNIHPQKLEVKFENERDVEQQLSDYLRGMLMISNLRGGRSISDFSIEDIPVKTIEYRENNVDRGIDKEKKSEENKEKDIYKVSEVNKENDIDKEYEGNRLSEVYRDFSLDRNPNTRSDIEKNYKYNRKEISDIEDTKSLVNDEISEYDRFKNNSFGTFLSVDKKLSNMGFDDILEVEPKKKDTKPKQESLLNLNYKYIGIIFDTYIILQKEKTMFLLDQHAAHERILYETYMKKYKNQDIESQFLLAPIIMEVNSSDIVVIEEHLEIFREFGFEVELFGNRHIAIRAVPVIFGEPESEKFILEILDNIDKINSFYDLRLDDLAQMSCKTAIKAHDIIDYHNVYALLEKLGECDNPHTCPHGRPVMVEIGIDEIEKMFKRRM